ncbi:MAG: right-handed parallel beta-helix repeat-containing protein [Proteobacteria bacterium]|jgi:parallel beta-helix repeat protein|nr:right-handed parallel beta-helix repeat-containing protein [Pseudomonadota bacterium]MDA1289957.1 right-handed parallel beta-helix repeat-containing protein [Pseudomonadota bacterium]
MKYSTLRVISIASATVLLASCGNEEPAMPQLSFEEALQEQLIQAKSGDVITIPAGVHEITRSLSLNVSGVTIAGAGIDTAVLSFKNQVQGAEGLLISANDFVIRDLAIEDTIGDALKINESNNVQILRVRTEWTNGPLSTNGAYGIYPVQSNNVLIDEAVAIGASDAGIYVGQSSQIIVRNSRAEYNVAGIEIENSTFADVHDNVTTNNTGGILVFDLPNLPVQGGRNTRVYRNQIFANNTGNFAPEGNIVAGVPAGTGLMIMANDNIEVFENNFEDNNSANVLIVSYLINEIPITDPNYDPFPEAIYLHNNQYTGGGEKPDSEPLALLQAATGQPLPDIIWDGMLSEGKTAADALCFSEAADTSFVSLDASNGFAQPVFDATAHDCAFPRLAEISMSLSSQ